ncbi:MAG: hypothetical protein V1763_01235 [Parcubacteria group bacterium]
MEKELAKTLSFSDLKAAIWRVAEIRRHHEVRNYFDQYPTLEARRECVLAMRKHSAGALTAHAEAWTEPTIKRLLSKDRDQEIWPELLSAYLHEGAQRYDGSSTKSARSQSLGELVRALNFTANLGNHTTEACKDITAEKLISLLKHYPDCYVLSLHILEFIQSCLFSPVPTDGHDCVIDYSRQEWETFKRALKLIALVKDTRFLSRLSDILSAWDAGKYRERHFNANNPENVFTLAERRVVIYETIKILNGARTIE